MLQLGLILSVRSWTPKEGEDKSTRFLMDYAVESQRRKGMEAANASISSSVFEKLKDQVPCFAGLSFGMGGTFQGRGTLTIIGAEVVSALKLPALPQPTKVG